MTTTIYNLNRKPNTTNESTENREDNTFVEGSGQGWKKLKKALAREDSWKKMVGDEEASNKKSQTFSFLRGEESHKVWKPKFSLSDVVAQMKEQAKHDTTEENVTEENSASVNSQQDDVHQRQETLMNRVNLAWNILKDKGTTDSDQIQSGNGKRLWKVAAKKVTHETNQIDFFKVVENLIDRDKLQ